MFVIFFCSTRVLIHSRTLPMMMVLKASLSAADVWMEVPE